MKKCINCSWKGENVVGPLSHCPVCGDNTETYVCEECKIPVSTTPKPSIVDRLKNIKDDLMDDGKLNYSNNPKKKSPGRKPKKTTKKKVGVKK